MPGKSGNPLDWSYLRLITRYDYDLTTRCLLITMASPPHECGARSLRRLFDPRMDKLTAKYGGVWNYDTNLRFHLFKKRNGVKIPMPSTFTPDGGILGADRDLMVALEVASTEQLANAHKKATLYLRSCTVIAVIIINLDEHPAYASPDTPNDWDSRKPFVDFKDWGGGGSWGPREFAGHCWGGVYTCQIEVHWPRRDGSTRMYRAVSHHFTFLHHYC